jgi:hypothetical protein
MVGGSFLAGIAKSIQSHLSLDIFHKKYKPRYHGNLSKSLKDTSLRAEQCEAKSLGFMDGGSEQILRSFPPSE